MSFYSKVVDHSLFNIVLTYHSTTALKDLQQSFLEKTLLVPIVTSEIIYEKYLHIYFSIRNTEKFLSSGKSQKNIVSLNHLME